MKVWNAWPIGTKVAIIVMLATAVANIRACFLTILKSNWRIHYIYRAIAWGLASTYVILLLTGILRADQYMKATQWVLPLLFFGALWSPMLHIWEERAIRSALTNGMGSRRGHHRSRRRHRRATRFLSQSPEDSK